MVFCGWRDRNLADPSGVIDALTRMKLVAAVALGAMLAGCGGGPGSAPPGAPVGGALEYTCGRVGFGPDLLEQPANAELADAPWAAALREFLATPDMEIDWLPDRGWRLVGVENDVAEYVAETEEPAFAFVSVEREDDSWKVGGWGGCQATAILEGLGVAEWTFDPQAGVPGPGATQFVALVTERACASGRPADGRIAPPRIFYGEAEIVVVFGVRPLAGGQDCPSNPSTPVVVNLAEPVGDREIVDGALFRLD